MSSEQFGRDGEKWNARYLDSSANWRIDRWIYRLQIVRYEIIDESDIHGGQRYRREASTRGPSSLSWRDQTEPVGRSESRATRISSSRYFSPPFKLASLPSWIRVFTNMSIRFICNETSLDAVRLRWLTTITRTDANADASAISSSPFTLLSEGIMGNEAATVISLSKSNDEFQCRANWTPTIYTVSKGIERKRDWEDLSGRKGAEKVRC